MRILLDESSIVKVCLRWNRPWDPWGQAILSTPFGIIGRSGGKIHTPPRPSEGHGIVLPSIAWEVGGYGEQARPRKDLPGAVALTDRDPDREPAIGSETSGDRDQAHRHETSLQALLGRQHLMGAPEDEDQDRIR